MCHQRRFTSTQHLARAYACIQPYKCGECCFNVVMILFLHGCFLGLSILCIHIADLFVYFPDVAKKKTLSEHVYGYAAPDPAAPKDRIKRVHEEPVELEDHGYVARCDKLSAASPYICMCTFYLHVYTFPHIYYIHVCICIYVYLCMYPYIYIYDYMCICTCPGSICVIISKHGLFLCLCLYVCWLVVTRSQWEVHTDVYVYLYIRYVYMCIYIYLHELAS